jgi:hypothetical protein
LAQKDPASGLPLPGFLILDKYINLGKPFCHRGHRVLRENLNISALTLLITKVIKKALLQFLCVLCDLCG